MVLETSSGFLIAGIFFSPGRNCARGSEPCLPTWGRGGGGGGGRGAGGGGGGGLGDACCPDTMHQTTKSHDEPIKTHFKPLRRRLILRIFLTYLFGAFDCYFGVV